MAGIASDSEYGEVNYLAADSSDSDAVEYSARAETALVAHPQVLAEQPQGAAQVIALHVAQPCVADRPGRCKFRRVLGVTGISRNRTPLGHRAVAAVMRESKELKRRAVAEHSQHELAGEWEGVVSTARTRALVQRMRKAFLVIMRRKTNAERKCKSSQRHGLALFRDVAFSPLVATSLRTCATAFQVSRHYV